MNPARLRWGAVLVGVLATATAAAAGPPTPYPANLAAQIARTALLENGGQSVAVTVTVICPAGGEVLEAFLYVSQDGNTSSFAGIPVTCDSKPHTTVVHPSSFDTPFHEGRAQASGYVLLESGGSISPTRVVRLKNA
jgi:hypothetical protein